MAGTIPFRSMRACFLFMLLLGLSCDRVTEASTAEGDAPAFYDLAGFIDDEVERLSGQPLTVEKTITLNGETERQEIDALDFGTDLRLFAGADINKNAWRDKYRVEEKTLSGRHRLTRYVALDSTLTTRLLEVEEDRGETRRLRIVRHTGTVLSDGRSQLEYEPARGYSVATQQDNRFGRDVDALVEVRWK